VCPPPDVRCRRADDATEPPAAEGPQPLSPKEVGSNMREYELMVIINPEVEDRAVEPTLKKFLEVVTKDNVTVDNVDIWGRRRLAYEIQKKTEGIYAVVRFTATPQTTQELDRVLNLNEAIMRTKIIRPEEQKISAE
jgi:small subunit ribosomal protein S6